MCDKAYKHARKYLGNLIYHQRRIVKNISMEKLANETNLDVNNLRRIERGEQFPESITLIKIIHALDINPTEFHAEIMKHIEKDEENKIT